MGPSVFCSRSLLCSYPVVNVCMCTGLFRGFADYFPYLFVLEKTVLDVGTGSGILAIWAAQAGARKVYAVEATKMCEHARQLIKANGLEGVVEVIEGSIEDVTLPEKGFLFTSHVFLFL